ncbi:alpha/beta hydrolase [Stigmatella aurantiaca]|uniref:Esterase/lipase/thioesterase n=1 Tax=Stigmatella aurantiaca (strain DW4/3-1) TaxID=378806 RepID=Q096T4_STIAD|nr:alpha/beta hydrolase [Stigmatella aurantiaca]ADO68541.1 Lipase/esterase [Stigmatella aurantiaca DW4/3-1]EAU67697.1 esterase/lipase/thioesterase [Stigmatella aurantiaca DW4/3-1]
MKRSFKWIAAALPMFTAPAALAEEAAPTQTLAPKTQAAVDAQMQQVLDAHKALNPKPLHTLEPKAARKGPSATDAVKAVMKKQGKPTEPDKTKLAKVDDTTLPGPAGDLPVRIYTPEGTGPFPVVVYYHGGGFVIADLDTYDAGPRALAQQTGAVVVSVHYRQAPEHPFPAAAHDAAAAFRYIQQNAAKYNGDPKRVAVAGESAGGNLATGVAMQQKKSGGPVPVFELLVYPFVSTDLNTPSHKANGQGNFLVSNQDLGWFWQNYLGQDWQKNKDPLAVPLQATPAQLKGLPPTMIITAGLDPLKDEGAAYAKKLQAAGVKTELKNYDGVTHEFFGMASVVDTSKRAQADAARALKGAFQDSGIGGSGDAPPERGDTGIKQTP